MLAEEFVVFEAESSLWSAVRPLLDAALQIEQYDETYSWYGWNKKPINAFLQSLPQHCTLLVGIWETVSNERDDFSADEHEKLLLSCVCEVVGGKVCSIRTFDALTRAEFIPEQDLEPGYEHALAVMRLAKKHIAPVAWALFTEKITWDEWIFAESDDGNKGELLASLARQGRCVLLGGQATSHHP